MNKILKRRRALLASQLRSIKEQVAEVDKKLASQPKREELEKEMREKFKERLFKSLGSSEEAQEQQREKEGEPF